MNDTITREQIKSKLDSKEPVTLVEALPREYFESTHLPGAINIPHDQIQEKAEKMLPDKDALIVVYCANTECQNSNIAASTLSELGYTRVFEYIEGKKHWLEADFPTNSAQ